MIRRKLKWLACALAAALPMVGCDAGTGVMPATVSDAPADPHAPSNLTVVQTAADTVELTWQDQAAYEEQYRVERKEGAGPYSLVTILPAGVTAYTDSGLAPNSTYTWKVAAVAGGLQGFAERTLTLIPASAPPGLSWADPAAAGTNLTVNGNGTVTDNQTALMWQQADDGTTRAWQSAIDYCAGLSLAGYNDWRLPNRHELQSLIDYTTYGPAIDTTAFPAARSSYYWSSSTYADVTYSAWYVYFKYGYVYDGDRAGSVYARCVRP